MTISAARTRRRLLTGGFAAALVAATGLPGHAMGRRGGHLVAGLSEAGFAAARAGAMGQTLTEISGDGSLMPALATGWESREGGRLWRFDLRGSVPGAAEVLGRFGDVRTAKDQLHLTLAQADPDLPFKLADPALGVPGEAGLYRLAAEDGTALRLIRQDGHWKEDRAGWADEVTLIRIQDPAARLAALRQGRVDVIDGLDAHAQRMLSARTDVTVSGDVAVSDRVGLPAAIGTLWPLDNGRMAERWWLG